MFVEDENLFYKKKDILFSQSLTLCLLVIKNYLEEKMSLYVQYV
jgi:hypothetical protein